MGIYSEESISAAILHATRLLGYDKLRAGQDQAIRTFLRGSDVFVCLPTGSGKSLCYCLLPAAFDHLRSIYTPSSCTPSIVVVVSPLIALMKDQVRAMSERRVSAVYWGDRDDSLSEIETDLCLGKYQLIFTSPEALLSDFRWRDMLLSPDYQKNLVGLIIDEAHCVKKWGDTFRKAFSELGEVRSLIPKHVQVMALTATATKATRLAVCRVLGMVSPAVVSRLPNRVNIKYVVNETPGTLEEAFLPLVEEIRHKRTELDRTIVYCRTYDSCSMIYLYLKSILKTEITEPKNARDLAVFRIVDMFTACTTPAVKESILQSFCKTGGTLRVVIATVAFGMGLDCPDVRKVIHWGPSSDIEQYLQETGRAGRDKLPSVAVLYVTNLQSHKVENSMKDYYKNKSECRRQLLLRQFEHCGNCESCISMCQCCDLCELICMCPSCSS